MLTATCHCGAVRIDVPFKPRRLTSCNCSICRRTGTLWAYYPASRVRITAAPGTLAEYVWGDKALRLVRCATCACVTHWESLSPTPESRMGVNARNFEPGAVSAVRVRRLDGAATWKFLD